MEANLKELGMDFFFNCWFTEDAFRQQNSKKIKDNAFIKLQKIQKGHDKVRYILFSDLSNPVNYLSNPLSDLE